jgi:hypothetical protein
VTASGWVLDVPDGYYAVPDPRDQAVTTYWRVRDGRVAAWPRGATYAPVLDWRNLPAEVTAGGTRNRDAVRARWHRLVGGPYVDAIRGAITADPLGCKARYAAAVTRCAVCGRRLTDPVSIGYGIGPECRSGMSDRQIAEQVAAVARMRAAWGESGA